MSFRRLTITLQRRTYSRANAAVLRFERPSCQEIRGRGIRIRSGGRTGTGMPPEAGHDFFLPLRVYALKAIGLEHQAIRHTLRVHAAGHDCSLEPPSVLRVLPMCRGSRLLASCRNCVSSTRRACVVRCSFTFGANR